MGGVIGAIVSLGASIFGSMLGTSEIRGDDKSRASIAANAASRAVWEKIVPSFKAGQMTAEEAGQAIQDVWDAYETWITSNIGDAQIAQRSIETQRGTLTGGLNAVGNPVLPYKPVMTPEGGLSNIANLLAGTGKELTKAGQEQMGKATGYYSAILEGGKGLEEATATGVSDLNRQYEQAIRRISQGTMRSGATAQTAAGAATSLMSEANKLKFQAKAGAAEQLGKLGAGEVSLGLGATGEAGTDWARLLDAQLRKSEQKRAEKSGVTEQILGTGKAAGTAISTILDSILKGSGKKTSGDMGLAN